MAPGVAIYTRMSQLWGIKAAVVCPLILCCTCLELFWGTKSLRLSHLDLCEGDGEPVYAEAACSEMSLLLIAPIANLVLYAT